MESRSSVFGRKAGDNLNVVAKTDDRDSILRAGRAQKIARRFANEIDPLFDTAGNVKQQDEIKRLSGRRNVGDLALVAVFVNAEVRAAQSADCPPVAIDDAGVDAHQLWRDGRGQLVGRTQADQRRLSLSSQH